MPQKAFSAIFLFPMNLLNKSLRITRVFENQNSFIGNMHRIQQLCKMLAIK